MPEPLLKIIARFDINDSPKAQLNGRAYLSAYNFEGVYNSDLVYAVNRTREIIEGPELAEVRKMPFKHTVAIVWGKYDSKKPEDMVDFFGWEFDKWEENAEISTWQTRNGILVKYPTGIQSTACEGGIEIINTEKNYRRYFLPGGFKTAGPKITELGLTPAYDFCSNQGRLRLRNLLREGKHIISLE
ncbi:MAG: hypothetical protein WC979_06315 [Candidatus Pacearchaeota archaeon]|jgi:hypothetical protein